MTCPSCPQSSVAHTYTGGPRGKKDNEVSHINDGSSPLSVFLLYFAETITLLVVETNCYYHDYIDRLDDGPSPEPDITEAEMFVFLALTIQMGHGVRDKLTDHWSTLDQLYTSFVTYILLTTGMNLKGQTKILTDYGRYETCLKL